MSARAAVVASKQPRPNQPNATAIPAVAAGSNENAVTPFGVTPSRSSSATTGPISQ